MRIEERKVAVVAACRGKKVLHLGCTDWPFTQDKLNAGELLHSQIAAVSSYLVGVDISALGIHAMQAHNPAWPLILADACTFRPDECFDVVVASEIIEHLENPGQLLRCVSQWASPTTQFIITTNNAQSLKSALRAVFGREECHPDHTVLFSTQTLSQLLSRTGWKVDAVSYYSVPAESHVMRLASGCVRLFSMVASARIREGLIVTATLKN
ncbi:MAG: methyltransferase domain-containing protein [Planctomycetota bacterium]|nr:methyltransferase domain-containing protein [Planctomycetota bacterium]